MISRHVFGHQIHNISSNISDHVGSQKLFVGTNPKWPDPKCQLVVSSFFISRIRHPKSGWKISQGEPKFPSCSNLSPEFGPPGSHCSLSWRLCLWPSRASGEGDACEARLRWIRSRSSTRLAGKAFVNLHFHGEKLPAGSKWWIFYIDIPSCNLT